MNRFASLSGQAKNQLDRKLIFKYFYQYFLFLGFYPEQMEYACQFCNVHGRPGLST